MGATPVLALLTRFPPPQDADALISKIRERSGRLPPGWPIGLEHRLLLRGFGHLSLSVATVESRLVRDLIFVSHTAEERDKLLRRPPSEHAAQLLWERAAYGPLDEETLFKASRLTGGGDHFRPARMATSTFPSGHYLEYLSAAQVRPRFARLLRRINAPDPNLHPLLHAIAIYFETLLIHPLRDGNGRLARLLFQLALRQTIGLAAPILPLGPACAASRPALIGAYLAWEFDRNARPLVEFLTAAVSALIDLYERRP